MIYKEIPINIYKVIHTGPNNQLGGLKNGLLMVKYHVDTDNTVKKEPIIPANWHIIIDAINLK